MGFWKNDIRIHSCGQVARMCRYLGLNISISLNNIWLNENQVQLSSKFYKFNDKILSWK